MTIQTLIFCFVVTFQCLPIRSIWDQTVKGSCLNLSKVLYAGSAVSIFEDLVVILLPIRELEKLSFTTKKKVALGFMFSLGSLCVLPEAFSNPTTVMC